MADEETEIQAENAQDERPAWLPSNFNSPEDLAKSYSHASSKITEQGQELAALKAQISEIQASQTQQTTQHQNDDLQAQIWEAFESGDGRAAAGAAAYLADLAVQKAMAEYKPETPAYIAEDRAALAHQELSARYPDWAEVSPEIGRLVQEDPGMLSVTATTPLKDVVRQLDRAYKLAKYEQGQTSTAAVTGDLAQLARQVKNAAQTMSGTNSSEEAKSPFDLIKEAQSGIRPFTL